MNTKNIIDLIEAFAPLETQEHWDNSGWQIRIKKDVKKILLCLSVTESILNQAIEKKCDMVIAHHPLFFIPFSFNKNIPIYSAHTNLDKADCGTTDTLIKLLGFKNIQKSGEFLRIVQLEKEISLNEFIKNLKEKLTLQNIRVVNNLNRNKISKIGFCAGSGADFLNESENLSCDAYVTGDLKYHTALDSNVIIADIGHFESEHPVLKTVKTLLEKTTKGIEVKIADEKSPFINY